MTEEQLREALSKNLYNGFSSKGEMIDALIYHDKDVEQQAAQARKRRKVMVEPTTATRTGQELDNSHVTHISLDDVHQHQADTHSLWTHKVSVIPDDHSHIEKLFHTHGHPHNSHLVFVYGSCSVKSLAEETGINVIASFPAVVPGYVRHYGRYSVGRKGAVASLRPAQHSDRPYTAVTGAVALIAAQDLPKLDKREGHPKVYLRQEVDAQLFYRKPQTTEILRESKKVYTYIQTQDGWVVPPSKEYLDLCLENLSHHSRIGDCIPS
eukprot:g77851.t1